MDEQTIVVSLSIGIESRQSHRDFILRDRGHRFFGIRELADSSRCSRSLCRSVEWIVHERTILFLVQEIRGDLIFVRAARKIRLLCDRCVELVEVLRENFSIEPGEIDEL